MKHRHYDIELPPLPRYTLLRGLHTSDQMREYAIEAIKADRQHRGGPVDPPGDNFGSAEHWKEKAQYWAAEAHKARQQALREEPVKDDTTARTSDDQP